MMKVYVGYEYYCYDGCEIVKNIAKIFDDEAKAIAWQKINPNWREFQEMDVV